MELIVFDLDGTLLDESSRISPFTRETLILLAKRKIAYTVATGRSLHSARDILHEQGFRLPHVYSNGVLIWDPGLDKLSMDNCLTLGEVGHVLNAAVAQDITPFISCIDASHQHFIYHPPVRTEVEGRLLSLFQGRAGVRIEPASDMPAWINITNISLIGTVRQIDGVQAAIANESHLVAYAGPALEGKEYKWMDIHHSSASKGGAISLLREQLGVTKVVCFGDSDNDLSMFAMADESYAPANAKDEVKAAATAIIGHHNADGIAHYLRERFDL